MREGELEGSLEGEAASDCSTAGSISSYSKYPYWEHSIVKQLTSCLNWSANTTLAVEFFPL